MAKESPKPTPRLSPVPMDQELALHILDNTGIIFEQYLLVRAELDRKQKASTLKLPPAELQRTYREHFKRKDRPAKYLYDLACVSALIQKYPNIQSREELENIARLYTQNAEDRLEQPIEEISAPVHTQTEQVIQSVEPNQSTNLSIPVKRAEETEEEISEWINDNLSEPK